MAHVAALQANVVSFRHVHGDERLAVLLSHPLLHHHAVGTWRNLPAGKDSCAGAHRQWPCRTARGNPLANRQPLTRIHSTQRVAIHCAVIERRHIQRGRHRFGQHAASGAIQRHLLGGERCNIGQQRLKRRFNRL